MEETTKINLRNHAMSDQAKNEPTVSKSRTNAGLVWQAGDIINPGWYWIIEDMNSKPTIWEVTKGEIKLWKRNGKPFEAQAGPIQEPY